MEKVTRRGFLVVAGTGAVLGSAFKEGEDDKLTDGGIADVSAPGAAARKTRIVPPGSRGHRNFYTRCVGCQLCVNVCPNNVLRPVKDASNCLQPEMGFEIGYCRPECVKCGEVCPAGAIRRITPAEKRTIHVGQATWHPDRCLAAQEGVNCSACEAHCPVRAIVRVPMDEKDANSPNIPVVDKTSCIGCGACEHLCPARPQPAMTVEGLELHREVRPMSEADVLAEAVSLIRAERAGAVDYHRDHRNRAQEKWKHHPSSVHQISHHVVLSPFFVLDLSCFTRRRASQGNRTPSSRPCRQDTRRGAGGTSPWRPPCRPACGAPRPT